MNRHFRTIAAAVIIAASALFAAGPFAALGAQTFVVPLKANDAMAKVVNDVSNALATLQSSFSGTSAPTSPAPVEGQFWWDSTNNILYQYNGSAWTSPGGHLALTTTTATPYAITAANGIVLIDATAGNKTATLPTAVGLNGTVFTVVKKDGSSNTVTIDPAGLELIGGLTTFPLAREGEAVTFTSDGAAWYLLSFNFPVPVHPTRGGTGITGYTAGDITYATAAAVLAKLAIGGAGAVLYSTGTGPAWSTGLTWTQNASDATLAITSNFTGPSNRPKVSITSSHTGGIPEYRLTNNSGDTFAFLLNGSATGTSGLYTNRQAAVAGSVAGGLLIINEGGDIIFGVNTGPNVEMMRVLSVGGVLFSNGALRDNDDFEIQCDYNNDGSNKIAFYNGTPTEIAQITEAGNLQIDGTATVDSTLRVGGGATLQKFITATATLNFDIIAAEDYEDLTITVTGAADGDTVSLGVPNGSVPAHTFTYFGWVSAADTVTIRAVNHNPAGSVDPASGAFRATVIDF
jgi:hypothetical protein